MGSSASLSRASSSLSCTSSPRPRAPRSPSASRTPSAARSMRTSRRRARSSLIQTTIQAEDQFRSCKRASAVEGVWGGRIDAPTAGVYCMTGCGLVAVREQTIERANCDKKKKKKKKKKKYPGVVPPLKKKKKKKKK